MRYVLLLSLVTAGAAAVSAPEPRCLCNAFNLSRCEGTGPVLQSYLWSDEGQRSQWFDLGVRYQIATQAECRALSYTAVPWDLPVFNYYGEIVGGCSLVWKNCDWFAQLEAGWR